MVIDASVASKWILARETYQELALAILESHKDKREQIVVPDFLFYEIANVLATKTVLTASKIKNSLSIIFEASLVVYNPDNNDILQSASLAKKYKTSVYDMLYAVVARRHRTSLITADIKFKEKTKFHFVKHISEYEKI